MAVKTGRHAAPPPESPGRPGRQKASARKRKRTPRAITALRIVFALVFCVAAYRIADALVSNSREQHTFRELQVIKAQSAAQAVQTPDVPEARTQQAEETPQRDVTDTRADPAPPAGPAGPAPLPQYAQLWAMNSEFFGWLTIEDLEIDYPVMYSPVRPEYYLKRDFYGKESLTGVPFIDEKCPRDGNYYLIHGHHITDLRFKSMFGKLFAYDDAAYWREHPTFRFDTVYEEREYEVLAAFYTKIYFEEDKDVFRYYRYTDLRDPAVFEEYVREVKAAACYDTGVTAVYGDELIALSTCSYHDANGRFVIVAKRLT